MLDSLQRDLDLGGTPRLRRILPQPRELDRLELEFPELAYLRTAILDRETLNLPLEELPNRGVRERLAIR